MTQINPAAWVFGGALLARRRAVRAPRQYGNAHFRHPFGARHAAGTVLVAYSLVGYPMVGWLAGHAYPRTPTFGLPCPTTIFTLGMLLLARPPVPVSPFVVPIV